MEENEKIEDFQFDDDYAKLFNEVNEEKTIYDSNKEELNEPAQNQEPKQEVQKEEQQVPVEQQPVNENVQEQNNGKQEVKQPEQEQNKSLNEEDLEKYLVERENKRKEIELAKQKEQEEILRKQQEEEELKKQQDKSIFDDYKFDSSNVINEEDKKVISSMEKEFPEIIQYFDIKLKEIEAKYQQQFKLLEKHSNVNLTNNNKIIYDKINGEILPVLKPLESQYNEMIVNQKLNYIKSKHPDYDQIEQGVDTWMKGIEDEDYRNMVFGMVGSGDLNKIVKVIDLYKKDLNIKTSQQQEEKKKEEDLKIISKRDALMSVNSKKVNTQSTQSKNYDDDDYASLWNSVNID